ncbi:MAG: hypothetical protein LV481_12060 [Methylacidiphilales bacterium]|nr:hypothetical protein [Candidatus Methylacidiphilales bacterium]
MRRLTLCVVIAAFAFSCGGQWYALQGVAWVSMLYDYSHMVSFPKAVEMTFSGEYPCPICKMIAEKKQTEKEKALEIGKDKQKFLTAETAAARPVFPASAPDYAALRHYLTTWSQAPPIPPPRCV